jgi:peptide/nickel transport system substrate-binding protein
MDRPGSWALAVIVSLNLIESTGEKKMRKINPMMAKLLAIIFFLVCLPVAALSRVKDDIRIALPYEPATVNMLELKTAIDLVPILNMHEALLTVDPKTGDYTTKNSLSTSVKLLPNGKDILFKLRKNAVFHTGVPVTAHDVRFTFEQCTHPENVNLMASLLDEIDEIEVVDDHTIIFHLYDPYAAWKELFWVGIASRKYYEKVGKKKLRTHPVGSGVYQFESRRIGSSITLKRFDKHPTFKPDVKRITFLVVPDEITRVSMLKIGELDLVSDINPLHLRMLKGQKGVVIKRESKVPSLFGIAMRVNNYPVWKDMYMARAMQYAINRQELIDRVFLKEGYPLYMSANVVEAGYDPSIKYEFNPAKAKQLLAKSAYKPGTPIILTYTNIVPNAGIVASVIQRYLKNIGMTVRLQQLELGTQATYSRNKDPREGHMVLYSWAGGRDPNMRLQLTVHSKGAYIAWSGRPSQKKMDKLVEDQAREVNVTKRKKLLKEIHKILQKETSGISLLGLNQIYGHQDHISYNWTPGQSMLFNLQTIKIVK